MASTRALAIPEILEMIVAQLPERDLLLSQRVNKIWQSVIKTSPYLQRKLFYTADLIADGSHYKIICKAKWNPLLKPFMKQQPSSSRSIRSVNILDVDALSKMNHPNPSWKSMFLTQPAGLHMEFWTCRPGLKRPLHQRRPGDDNRVDLDNATGVKVGEVWDVAVWELRKEEPNVHTGTVTEFAIGIYPTWDHCIVSLTVLIRLHMDTR